MKAKKDTKGFKAKKNEKLIPSYKQTKDYKQNTTTKKKLIKK